VYEVRVHEQAQATLDALLAEVIVAYMGVLDVLEWPLGVGSRCAEITRAGTRVVGAIGLWELCLTWQERECSCRGTAGQLSDVTVGEVWGRTVVA
jgi:hypothetical protein